MSVHPACELCRGSCCESVAMPIPQGVPPDTIRWMKMRGEVRNMRLILEVPCENLELGRCGIYASRPQPCREYPVGGAMCRDAIERRRPEHADEIKALLPVPPTGVTAR